MSYSFLEMLNLIEADAPPGGASAPPPPSPMPGGPPPGGMGGMGGGIGSAVNAEQRTFLVKLVVEVVVDAFGGTGSCSPPQPHWWVDLTQGRLYTYSHRSEYIRISVCTSRHPLHSKRGHEHRR